MTGYMTPTNPGSTGYGLSWKFVRVSQLFPEQRIALVVDQFGKGMEISYAIMSGKGLRPDPGEDWVIEHKFGRWIFSAILTGGGNGVTVDTVDGLPDALGDIGDSIDGHSTALTALDARADLNEAPGKHLWRQNSNATTTVSVTAGATPLTLTSPYAVSDAGIATFSSTTIKLNRAGRWGVSLRVKGAPTANGTMVTELAFGTPSFATADGGTLNTSAYGTAVSAYCASTLPWTGWASTAQAAVTVNAKVYWTPDTGSSTLPILWTLGLEYLGPF